ncbi:hypothetical protein Tco_0802538 [Tanacetum coccineum]|uniref:Uncharacterized protein n=1 Tax=Tanacetum coccineum TaxID=301880 RepID=A0ABQ4ZZY6_9ASTR
METCIYTYKWHVGLGLHGLIHGPLLTNYKPSAHRTPTPTTIVGDVVQKKRKRKQVIGETSSPKPSLKIRVKQTKPSTTLIPPPNDDRERDEIAEATQLSLSLHKTAKIAEEQENVAIVQEKLMEEDIEKIVDGDDEESFASEFADLVFQDDTNYSDDKKDDDDNDDHTDQTFDKTQEIGSLETRKEKMQTPILLPHRSPRTNLSTDNIISKELTDTASPIPDNTSQGHSKLTSINTKDLLGGIAGMSIRRGKIRKHLNTTFVTNDYFQEKMREIPDLLKNLVP